MTPSQDLSHPHSPLIYAPQTLKAATFPSVFPPLLIFLYFSLQTAWYLFSVISLSNPQLPCPFDT